MVFESLYMKTHENTGVFAHSSCLHIKTNVLPSFVCIILLNLRIVSTFRYFSDHKKPQKAMALEKNFNSACYRIKMNGF